AACGYALARLMLPVALSRWWPLFVLPFGAAASGLALTVLGFAAVPFKVSLGVVLAAGVVSAVLAHRRAEPADTADPRLIASLAFACVLIVCVALIPSFRSG